MFKWINSKRNLFIIQLLLLDFDWFNCSKSKQIESKNQRRDPKLGNLSHHWAIGDFPIHGTYCWVMFFLNLGKEWSFWSWNHDFSSSSAPLWSFDHAKATKVRIKLKLRSSRSIWLEHCFASVVFQELTVRKFSEKKTTPDPISRKFIFHEVYEDLRRLQDFYYSYLFIVSCLTSSRTQKGRIRAIWSIYLVMSPPAINRNHISTTVDGQNPSNKWKTV